MNDYGRRTRLNLTRAGVVAETYFICYLCPAELQEHELEQHEHEHESEKIMENYQKGQLTESGNN